MMRFDWPWCFAVKSDQFLVFCGEIRLALVFCGGFQPVLGVFRRDPTALGVLWRDLTACSSFLACFRPAFKF
jgi:hypothetical protein